MFQRLFMIAIICAVSGIHLSYADDNLAETGSNRDSSELSSAVTKKRSQMDTPNDDNNYDFFVSAAYGGAGVGGDNGSFGPAWSINLGYNFNKIFAIEADYTGYMGLLGAPVGYAILGSNVSSGGNNVFDIAFRSTLHLSQFFSMYGKVGPAINNGNLSVNGGWSQPAFSDNVNAFGGLVGGGASVDLWHVSLFGEVDRFVTIANGSPNLPTDYTSAFFGVRYNF